VSFVSARPSLHRPGPFKKEPDRFRTLRVRLSWGSCSRGHNYVGCPFSVTRFLAVAREGRGSPDPRRCRPQGSCPSRRFRLRSRRLHGSLAEPAASPWRPDASRPYSMPLASLWRCPPELSLPEEPYPLSRASLLPCGFAFDCRQRDDTGIFATAFPVESALCLRPPESERRRMNRDDGCLATARSAAWTHP
jgi:hypothetical protein